MTATLLAANAVAWITLAVALIVFKCFETICRALNGGDTSLNSHGLRCQARRGPSRC
jgi:hypothetical protein